MGLFKSIFKKEDSTIKFSFDNELQAWMVFIYVTVSSDGDFSDTETQTVMKACQSIKLFKGLDPGSGFEKISEGISSGLTINDLVERAIPSVPKEHRPTLFSILCELTMCDGDFNKSEISNLEEFKKALEIDNNVYDNLIKAFTIRYKLS